MNPLGSIAAFLAVLAVGAFFQWIGQMTVAYIFYAIFALGVLFMIVMAVKGWLARRKLI